MAGDEVRNPQFPLALRGYDREAVDRYVAEVIRVLTDLEATQSRDTVVQRALDEVGEQTSGILQRAHESAEETGARARAQAEGRLQRAEREAVSTVAEAEAEAERVRTEVRGIWQARARLLEDLRRLSDEVLGVADDAIDRLGPPEGVDEAPHEPEGVTREHRALDTDEQLAAVPEEAPGAIHEETGDQPALHEADEPRDEVDEGPTGPLLPQVAPAPAVPEDDPTFEGPSVRRVGPERRSP